MHLPVKDWLGKILKEENFNRFDFLIDTNLVKTFDEEYSEPNPQDLELAFQCHPDCVNLSSNNSGEDISDSFETSESDESDATGLDQMTDTNECQRTLPVKHILSDETYGVKIKDFWSVINFLDPKTNSRSKSSEVYNKYEVSQDQYFEKVYN